MKEQRLELCSRQVPQPNNMCTRLALGSQLHRDTSF